MTDQADIILPLSALEFTSAARAEAMAEAWSTVQIGGLLQHAVTHFATSELDAGNLHTVSVTFDVSFEPEAGREIVFESRIDRKTRTLIFASGIASQADQVLMKATIVYRIA